MSHPTNSSRAPSNLSNAEMTNVSVLIPHEAMIALSTIFTAIGVAGNVFLLITMKRKRLPRSNNDYLLIQLSSVDLIVVLTTAPVSIFHKLKFFGICDVHIALITFSRYLTVFTLVVIAAERHSVISSVLSPTIKGKKLFLLVLLSWVVSVLCVSPLLWVPHIGPVDCQRELSGNDMKYRKIYYIFLFVFQYFAPLAVIVVLYTKAMLVLNRYRLPSTQEESSNHKTPSPQRVRLRARNLRVLKRCIAMVSIFAACMLPQHVAYLWIEFGGGHRTPSRSANIFLLTYFLVVVNCSLDPVIYGAINHQCQTCSKNAGADNSVKLTDIKK